ncbi:MAG: hypothetical protein KGV51_00235 [Moraxellaceae bacterium]|nr:hypothetical protein [Moraxellaceae bacterium]
MTKKHTEQHQDSVTVLSSIPQQTITNYHFAKTLNELAISNPTNLSNPYWQVVVGNNWEAYKITNLLDFDEEISLPPLWSM